MENYEPYYNLALETIARCFTPPYNGDTYSKRRAFVGSPLIDIFCDCADIDAGRLRKAILKYNGQKDI